MLKKETALEEPLFPHIAWTKDPGLKGREGTGWWLWLEPGEPFAGPFETSDEAVDYAELVK